MSAFDPFDPALFSMTAGCLPCCAPPGECACAMLIPPFTSPYADYATAATAIADEVYDCLVYAPVIGPVYDSFVVTTGTNSIEIAASKSPTQEGQQSDSYFDFTALSGSSLSVAYSVTNTGITATPDCSITVTLYDCHGSTINTNSDADSSASISGTFVFSIPADGIYVLRIVAATNNDDSDFDGIDLDVTSTCDNTMVVNPVIALYDDSGTTRQLEACPKLFIPPFTESTGTWYADASTAAAVLADPLQVSNCVGYAQSPPTNAFTATDGGTSLVFTTAPTSIPAYTLWGSINLEAGETLDVGYVIIGGVGGYGFGVNVYDYTGTGIDSGSVSASPSGTLNLLVSGAPYTGRYIIRINGSMGSPAGNATFTVTSSGVLSVNQIQALWDALLDCPGRTDC